MSELHKKITDSLRKGHPFNEDVFVKERIASAFWRDGRELLERADQTSEWASLRKSATFKYFIDLLMSLECSLKSLVIATSPSSELPEASYNVARRLGHNLEALVDKVISRNPALKGKINRKLLVQINKIGINPRYSLDVIRLFATEPLEKNFFRKGDFSRVLHRAWIRKVRKQVAVIGTLAHKEINDKFPGANIRVGSEITRGDTRFKKFIAEAF